MMDSNGQFSDIGCLPAKSLPQLRRNAALAMAALAKGGCVRLADIYVFSCEGPVWIILLFKQLFICVHFYQLCQAEELL